MTAVKDCEHLHCATKVVKTGEFCLEPVAGKIKKEGNEFHLCKACLERELEKTQCAGQPAQCSSIFR